MPSEVHAELRISDFTDKALIVDTQFFAYGVKDELNGATRRGAAWRIVSVSVATVYVKRGLS